MNAANFSTANLTDSVINVTYFFTVPAESASRNCSGDVVSIQYCYRARNINQRRNPFVLLDVARNGLEFTIINRTFVRTNSTDSTCTASAGSFICCDTTSLITRGFEAPSSEYTFGIVDTSNTLNTLAFADSVTEYRVEQFRDSLGDTVPAPGNISTLTEGDRLSNHSLLLIRFIIGKLIIGKLISEQ